MKNRSLPSSLIFLVIVFSFLFAGCSGNGTAAPIDIHSLDIHPAGGLVSQQHVNLYFSAVSERQREKFEKWLQYWYSSTRPPFEQDAVLWWACVFDDPDEPNEIYRLLNVDGTLYTLPKDYHGSKVPTEDVYGEKIKPEYAPVEVISADEISRLSVINGALLLLDEGMQFDVQERAWVPQTAAGTASTQVAVAPTPTFIPTPSSPRPLTPAPVVPQVSGPITPENVSQIKRLASLGEGDLLNMQLSPDGEYLVLGTSNGVLVLNADSLSQAFFLPTAMKAEFVTFIKNGEQLTARDKSQGYVWSFPGGEEISRAQFRCVDPAYDTGYCSVVPNEDLSLEYSTGMKSGLIRTSDGSLQYELAYTPQGHVAISPDSQYLAVPQKDHLTLVNYADGSMFKEIPEQGILDLFFFTDGKTLGGIKGSQIEFWSIPGLELIDTITVYDVGNVRFSPDQSVFALTSEGNVRVYRAEDRLLLTALPGIMFTFSPDSQSLLIDGGEGYVHLYQFDPDRTKLDFQVTFAGQGIRDYYGDTIQAGVFSTDSQKLLLMKTTGVTYTDVLEQLLVYDVGSGSKVQAEFQPYQDLLEFQHAIWLPDQQAFALIMCPDFSYGGCYLGTISAQSGSFQKYLEKDDDREESRKEIEFSTHSDLLVSASGNNTTFIWDLHNSGYWQLPVDPAPEYYGPYNTEIAFLLDDFILRYLDTAGINHNIVTRDFTELDWCGGRFFNPGEGLVGWTENSYVIIQDTQSLEELLRIEVWNTDLDFNLARNLLATLSEEGGVNVWDVSELSQPEFLFTGKVYKQDFHRMSYNGEVSFSPNGEFVAAHYVDFWPYYKISIWSTQDGSLVHQLNGENSSQYKNVTYSSDSRMIVVSEHTMDGNDIGFYDLQTGEQLFRLNYLCKGDYPPEISISPDGKYLGMLCSFGYPQIWGVP